MWSPARRKGRRAKMRIRNSITSFFSLSLFSEVLLDMWAVSRPLRQMQRNVGYETRYFPSPKMPSRSIVLGRSQFVFTEKLTFPNSNPCTVVSDEKWTQNQKF